MLYKKGDCTKWLLKKELEKKAVEIAEKVGEETAKIESEAKEVEEKSS